MAQSLAELLFYFFFTQAIVLINRSVNKKPISI